MASRQSHKLQSCVRFAAYATMSYATMSIVKVKYDLSNPDDRIEHLQTVNASNMAFIIWDFLYNSRKEIEHKIDNQKLNADGCLDAVYERFVWLLDQYHIDIDQLVV